ncbi:hypothetical protein GCM10010988_21190 [Cnuibacter physcomitrellae]|uniref:Uncharacterized protein n=1 Tax=Cnuibacter physcomitrellae TaxID=1619308 RepID=A0A1X9LR49_9MICO|nr:hypothetical protein [Cnuibacter physcomitrellae]ARJ06798.1 hypothetical protein B5808_17405 [Cnuibacter physcomitrellae]GGI38862.1 hypothetical protein GCM10010988_21190 [Cnuibacter physcomitrellae]
MGWFGRKRSEAPQPDDRIQWVTSTARRLLAEKGVESTVEFGERLEDAQLVAADGRRFPIYNLVPKTEGASREAAERLIDQHLDLVLGTATDPDPSTFDPEDLRARVRTRILPVVDDPADAERFGYGRPFAEGLITVLCIDFPQTVRTLTTRDLDQLPLGLDELYGLGQFHTDHEPIEKETELVPGIRLFEGGSLFIASKAANLTAVTGPAPFGTVFAVPNRHMLLTLELTGPDSLVTIQQLVSIVLTILQDPVPGGPISPDLYFSRDGMISRISSLDPSGKVTITVGEHLQRALDDAGLGDA